MNKTNSINKHFLTAITTRNLQMFRYDSEEQKIKNSVDIIEHLNRLLEISDNCHFYMDEDAFEAFGYTGFPQRFTRVFVQPTRFKHFKRGKFHRVHLYHELDQTVQSKDFFSPEVKIFFIGNSKFLKLAEEYCSKLLLTVVDAKIEPSSDLSHFFPIEYMKTHFKKRRDIQPEMLEMIQKYRQKNRKKTEEERYEIADNGMKIIRQKTKEENQIYDELLDTPDYMFYEYAR